MNQFKTTISITRGELCDLLLATIAAQQASNDGGKKWIALHEKLHKQLEDLDNDLYRIEKNILDIYG